MNEQQEELKQLAEEYVAARDALEEFLVRYVDRWADNPLSDGGRASWPCPQCGEMQAGWAFMVGHAEKVHPGWGELFSVILDERT